MNVYRVSVQEVWIQDYLVLADDSDSAKEKVFKTDQDIYIDDEAFEYSHTEDSSKWCTEELPLRTGDIVDVGNPQEGDLHTHAFQGRIVTIVKNDNEEYCSVVDSDDNMFDVGLDNMSLSKEDIDLSEYLS